MASTAGGEALRVFSPSSFRVTIQWDKNDLEDLGLFKVDLLGLGALRQLKLCFDLLQQHWGLEYSMATIPAEDPRVFDMMCKSDTVGVFQIESRAQMAMLPRPSRAAWCILISAAEA
jgi:error-prone DNA polymerase